MPATVIDSLVVTLGLDTSKFDAGSQHATEQFKKTGESVDRLAKHMEEKGKVAAEFFVKTKEKALDLLAVMIGGRGLEEIIRHTVENLASLGRAAQNIGVAVPELAAFRNMIEANGGSADEAAASLQRLADSMAELKATGTTAILPGLEQIGGVKGENAIQTYMRFVEFATAHKNDIGLIRLVGARLGLDQGSINEALKGTVQVAKDLAAATARGVPTKEMTERAKALEDAWLGLSQAARHLTDVFVDELSPALTAIFETITEFVKEHPQLATAGAIGLGIGGLGLAKTAISWLFGGGKGGAVAAVAQEAAAVSLTGAAAALTAAAVELSAAAVALGAGGVAGNAVKTAVGAGAARTAAGVGAGAGARTAATTVASRSLFGTALRWAGPIGAFIAGMWPSPTQTQEQENAVLGRGPIGAGGGGGGSGTADLTMTPAKRAVLDTIAGGESSGPNAYSARNPKSTAYGRYQFIDGTWRDISSKTGLTERTPENQDKNAWYLAATTYRRMTGRNLEADVAAGGHASEIAAALKSQWPSMPGGSQQNTQMATFERRLNAGVGAMQIASNQRQAGAQQVQVASRQAGAASAISLQRQAESANRQQVASNDNAGSQQNIDINGPIIIHTQATDAPGVARALRSELSGRKLAAQANTGLA